MWFRSHLWSELNTLTNTGRLVSTGQGAYEKVRSGWHRLAQKRAAG